MATGETVSLSIDGKARKGSDGARRPDRLLAYAGMDSGRDNGEVVWPEYREYAAFAFTGTIEKVVFDNRRPEDPDAEAATVTLWIVPPVTTVRRCHLWTGLHMRSGLRNEA